MAEESQQVQRKPRGRASASLRARQATRAVAAELRERMAIVANFIEAVERVLESLGYQGKGAKTTRAARVVLFYRNELRAELAKSAEPLTAREPARRLCQVEGNDGQDRRRFGGGRHR